MATRCHVRACGDKIGRERSLGLKDRSYLLVASTEVGRRYYWNEGIVTEVATAELYRCAVEALQAHLAVSVSRQSLHKTLYVIQIHVSQETITKPLDTSTSNDAQCILLRTFA